MTNRQITLRPAAMADASLILEMIKELAEFEQLAHEVTATADRICRDLFGPKPFAEALIGCVDGTPAGMAIYFYTYSTFVAAPGMYLEDLYVQPRYRRAGLGRRMLQEVGRIAVERGCSRYEWSVLDWNTNAIRFYQQAGAVMAEDWRRMRVDGAALHQLAAANINHC